MNVCNTFTATDDYQRNILTDDYTYGQTPASIASIYGLPATIKGQVPTVTVITAHRFANTESDLRTYRARFGLPSCGVSNGCLTFVDLPSLDPNGDAAYTAVDYEVWVQETALDLDAVSAACPQCHIQVVRTAGSLTTEFDVAVDTAVQHGAKYISMSYTSQGESPADLKSIKDHYTHPGVMLFAASGDRGHTSTSEGLPQSSPTVIAVGGTSVTPVAPGKWRHVAWGGATGNNGGAGSSCSSVVPKPAFQVHLVTGCSGRASADISAIGDPQTGLAVYESLSTLDGLPAATVRSGWRVIGGTSLATPLVAAMAAREGARALSPLTLYAHARSLLDVTVGDNYSCVATQYCVPYLTQDGAFDPGATYSCPGATNDVQCVAGKGWDGPTGLGTPVGPRVLSF